MISCEQAQALLPFYPRADMARDAFRAVSEHLTCCATCRHELAALQASNAALQAYMHALPDGELCTAQVAIAARLRQVASALVRRRDDSEAA